MGKDIGLFGIGVIIGLLFAWSRPPQMQVNYQLPTYLSKTVTFYSANGEKEYLCYGEVVNK